MHMGFVGQGRQDQVADFGFLFTSMLITLFKGEVAFKKLLRLDSVRAVGLSGWKLYFRTVESPMRSSIVGWGKRKGVPLRLTEPLSGKAVSFIFKW